MSEELADPTTRTEAIHELVRKALAAGGQPANDPIDLGFMYASSFQDLDGHL